MIKYIAAVSEDNVLAVNGEIPWSSRKDMALFRAITLGHTVVVGRKTYETFSRPLIDRRVIVLTSKQIEDVECVNNPSDILDLAAKEDVFVIGGGQIYDLFKRHAKVIYLSTFFVRCKSQDIKNFTEFISPDYIEKHFYTAYRDFIKTTEFESSDILFSILFRK